MSEKYWPEERHSLESARTGAVLELRTSLALTFVEHWGMVAARIEGEDAAGRAKMALQEPAVVVARAFEIADLFVAEAERRGGIRAPTVTMEEAFAFGGTLRAIQTHAEFADTEARRERIAAGLRKRAAELAE